MKLEFENNKFVVSDLDYETFQIFYNAINKEKNKIAEKIFYLTSCLFQDYSENKKEEFKMQIDFLRLKQEEINKDFNQLKDYYQSIELK